LFCFVFGSSVFTVYNVVTGVPQNNVKK